jgi:hypothetical protein
MIVDNNGDINQYTSGGSSVPAPPKPGEVIICQCCGKPIMPDQFSKNPFQRKFEFKWHLHPWCKEDMMSQADRGTPGLLSERKQAEKRNQQR